MGNFNSIGVLGGFFIPKSKNCFHRVMQTVFPNSLNFSFTAFGHSYLPSDSIFPESIVEMHVIEGANATSEFSLLTDLPGYEEWAKNNEDKSC